MDEYADELDAIERATEFDAPPWEGDRDARLEVGAYVSRYRYDCEGGQMYRLTGGQYWPVD